MTRQTRRRTFVPISLCAALLFTVTGTCVADDFANPFKKDRVDVALEKAVKYLVGRQQADGSIRDSGNGTAMTSLAIMAMAAIGNQPGDPTPAGKAMKKALQYVLSKQDKDGYFGNSDGSRMYGHGITTLMLTEMLGMGQDGKQDKAIHASCQRAIDLILSSQQEKKPSHFRGGWRYHPNAKDADLSVSVWQLMALRSAKNDGLKVPDKAIEQAVGYLQRSFVSHWVATEFHSSE